MTSALQGGRGHRGHRLLAVLRARPHLLVALLAGATSAFLLPASMRPVTRTLSGWDVAVWLYLVLQAQMMYRADHDGLRRRAIAHAEGELTVLLLAVLAALASLAGVVAELAAARAPGTPHAATHLAFTLVTVVGSWLLVPMLFTLSYASAHHGAGEGGGLRFPDPDPAFRPRYPDFLYFSFTIAVASQTADVGVASPRLRRLVLLHSVVSFAFNTAVLAFTINVAAGMF